jgi:hypothetical protein
VAIGNVYFTSPGAVSVEASSSATVNGDFRFVSTGSSLTVGASAAVSSTGGDLTLSTPTALSIGAGAALTSNGAMNLSAGTTFSMGTGVAITNNGQNTDITLSFPDGASNNQTWTDVTVNGPAEGELIVGAKVAMTLAGTTAINANVRMLNLTSFTQNSGASISANAKGCLGGSGGVAMGPNSSNVCVNGGQGSDSGSSSSNQGTGGGANGGAGGSGTTFGGGATFGSAIAPVFFGAAGGNTSTTTNSGGAGGGLVRITATGAIVLDGTLSANAGNAIAAGAGQSAGGGAGGSIAITAGGQLSGAIASISAKGGNGGLSGATSAGGGGGGGRISLTYASAAGTFASLTSSVFDVTAGIKGGLTATDGVKGTVYTKNTTANTVAVYHGFTYDTTPISVSTWTIDASATNQ